MADYLKGTVTEAYLRCMNQGAAIVVTPELEVRSLGLDGDAPAHIYDKDGGIDIIVEAAIIAAAGGTTWALLTNPQRAAWVFINAGATASETYNANVTIEPWMELSEMSPELTIDWDEFDAIGTPVMQHIPIRKSFSLSFTQKAVDGYWQAILFGDYNGNFAHHGVHTVGTIPTLTCFEGKNELGSDIGYQVNIVMGRQTGGRWVVLRAKNLCYHACSNEISPAAISNRTIEFAGNHGYYYTVANIVDNGANVPDITKFHWALADGS